MSLATRGEFIVLLHKALDKTLRFPIELIKLITAYAWRPPPLRIDRFLDEHHFARNVYWPATMDWQLGPVRSIELARPSQHMDLFSGRDAKWPRRLKPGEGLGGLPVFRYNQRSGRESYM